MCRQLEELKKERQVSLNNSTSTPHSAQNSNRRSSGGNGSTGLTSHHHPRIPASASSDDGNDGPANYECVALHISPDLGERIMLSGERALIDESFPETSQALMDARSSVAWNHDARHVIRFPLNGYCKINSMQAITRLLNAGFKIAASNGGGVEGQQFSEYLFVRRVYPM
ncbi:hypothetical protein B566_EDAN004104 [Ephemera danica]|nr:hypothetical protein B566_EDAN004104 [Ephemera danica]